jgi:hypothetical protein
LINAAVEAPLASVGFAAAGSSALRRNGLVIGARPPMKQMQHAEAAQRPFIAENSLSKQPRCRYP